MVIDANLVMLIREPIGSLEIYKLELASSHPTCELYVTAAEVKCFGFLVHVCQGEGRALKASCAISILSEISSLLLLLKCHHGASPKLSHFSKGHSAGQVLCCAFVVTALLSSGVTYSGFTQGVLGKLRSLGMYILAYQHCIM